MNSNTSCRKAHERYLYMVLIAYQKTFNFKTTKRIVGYCIGSTFSLVGIEKIIFVFMLYHERRFAGIFASKFNQGFILPVNKVL